MCDVPLSPVQLCPAQTRSIEWETAAPTVVSVNMKPRSTQRDRRSPPAETPVFGATALKARCPVSIWPPGAPLCAAATPPGPKESAALRVRSVSTRVECTPTAECSPPLGVGPVCSAPVRMETSSVVRRSVLRSPAPVQSWTLNTAAPPAECVWWREWSTQRALCGVPTAPAPAAPV